MVATAPDGIYVGTSGWSYPTWRPGFYPAGTRPESFLAHYARHFRAVELNTTAYRLPSEEQFRRWADAVPDGFRFAVKLPVGRLDRIGTFVERVTALGDRLGPLRVVVQSARDDGLLAFLQGSLDPALAVAYDFRHPSWDDVAGVVRVGDLDGSFAYLRLREPPYSDDDLDAVAGQIATAPRPAYLFFRHEADPTAPRYAERLLAALAIP
jgi:uncharacterized protein YecE (DUF72 family)